MANLKLGFNDVSVKSSNMRVYMNYHKRFFNNVNYAFNATNREVAEFVEEVTRPFVPVKTGALLKSTRIERLEGTHYNIVYDMPYAEYVYRKKYPTKTGYGKRGPWWFHRMYSEYRSAIYQVAKMRLKKELRL